MSSKIGWTLVGIVVVCFAGIGVLSQYEAEYPWIINIEYVFSGLALLALAPVVGVAAIGLVQWVLGLILGLIRGELEVIRRGSDERDWLKCRHCHRRVRSRICPHCDLAV